MEVANIENCKKLYELSGWDNTADAIVSWTRDNIHSKNYELRNSELYKDFIPAYDLGYLLRRLPKQRMGLAGTTAGVWFNVKTGKWACEYTTVNTSGNHKGHLIEADTPEDALCLLVIELFNQGILSKQEEKNDA